MSLAFGFNDCVLHVDLETKVITREAPGEAFFRKYLGGRALIAHYLLKLLPENADPLGPENVLIFAPGIVTGSPVSGQGRNGVGGISPLTGGFASAEGGGFVGSELKRAGIDAIVFRGRSERPVYLWINEGGVELRDASHLWGKEVGATEEAIRAELGSERIRTALIGQAGENMVRYAAVVNDRSHFSGRGGMGAVMGSKNLKGIACLAPRGGKMALADAEGVSAIQKWMGANLKTVARFHEFGTTAGVRAMNGMGSLPVNNFKSGSWEHAEDYTGETINEIGLLVGTDTCAACAVRCKRVVEAETPLAIDRQYGGPEYETLSGLGNCVGVHDVYAISKANERCAAYGMDSISVGATIAWAMECRERGLLPEAPEFGDTAAMMELVEKIAHRDGPLADMLADGVVRAAAKVGKGSEEFAMHVKGQEFPMHEPRTKHALGLGYAISPTGACHVHNMHDGGVTIKSKAYTDMCTWGEVETANSIHGYDDAKMTLFYRSVNLRHAQDSMIMCVFLPYTPKQLVEFIQGVTGWTDFDEWDLLQVGVRANTMSRLVNVQRGFTTDDDRLPKRMFEELADSKNSKPIDLEEFNQAKHKWYEMMGWDPETGVPLEKTLAELGIA